MNRGIAWLFGFLVLLGLVRLGVFVADRRGDRASNTLRRELLDLGPTSSPRPLHVHAPLDAGSAELLTGLFDPAAPVKLDALLEATHAATGGLPPGLAIATTGRDAWQAATTVADTLAAAELSGPQCLDALALARDLARGGGTLGIAAAAQLTDRVFPRCARVLIRAPAEGQAQALEALIDGAPSLARAFREADLDLQVHTFGGWMRPEDIAELPAEIQRAAHEAKALPSAFFERQALLGVWAKLSKTTHAAMTALELPAAERDRALEALEAKIETPSIGVSAGWRSAIANHERRLMLLRMLHLGTRLALDPSQRLSEVEAGDFTLTPGQSDTRVLTLRGTQTKLEL